MIWLLACSSPCPEGFGRGPQAELERLAGVELAPVCLGDLEHSVTDGQVLLLDRGLEPAAAAARARHLQHHLEHPPLTAGPGCLERAVGLEAQAWQLELGLRRDRELPALYPFEGDWRAAPSHQLIEAWLWDNPSGGPHVDGLVDAYRLRCEDD